ncbi:sensor domain-containing protein [Arenimonas oryziterrae]|uniref:Putative sensor domain-containing protein n=1 Tax=Arenimonas oryziterrae DSM 21050 = YC6267 TaxID=1121015 RepID=A0A091BKK9_9GAMM|nr:sensor domain-containing protein [Arenimonas oryziterrae]KFN44845.1 hypothetical protein N789_02180 [Arenimonas oryziterrae DSM 21050 = YC6267]
MTATTPKTIPEYLDQLRQALAGADPALLQDALYDAEEYLRSELAAQPGVDEATLLASIATSYGAPDEVADIYRQTESTVVQALRPPPKREHRSLPGKFFGVLADPRAYTSLFYMLLSLATGTLYFTWAVTGISLSLGLAILIIGIPVAILFFASVRGISLVEGRLVEAMLGERMPRRPLYTDRDQSMMARIKTLFTDPRTWSSMIYMVMMQPLGVAYFTFATVAISLSAGVAAIPVIDLFNHHGTISIGDWYFRLPLWTLPLTIAAGVVMFVLTLHIARGIGRVHALLAKHLLVQSAA